MTEAEWRGSDDFGAMLDAAGAAFGDRKARLFAVGCCRRVDRLIRSERARRAVEVAEEFAEGRASLAELRLAAQGAKSEAEDLDWEARNRMKLSLAAARDGARVAALAADRRGVRPWDVVRMVRDGVAATSWSLPEGWECALLRCLLGPTPFRKVEVDPRWLAWDGGTVATMAGSIDAERDYRRLPILGDALEEAGCGDADILDHCRGGEEHARGCWVVDLILGRSI